MDSFKDTRPTFLDKRQLTEQAFVCQEKNNKKTNDNWQKDKMTKNQNDKKTKIQKRHHDKK